MYLQLNKAKTLMLGSGLLYACTIVYSCYAPGMLQHGFSQSERAQSPVYGCRL